MFVLTGYAVSYWPCFNTLNVYYSTFETQKYLDCKWLIEWLYTMLYDRLLLLYHCMCCIQFSAHKVFVEDFMIKNIKFLTSNTTYKEAQKLLDKYSFRSFPLVDSKGTNTKHSLFFCQTVYGDLTFFSVILTFVSLRTLKIQKSKILCLNFLRQSMHMSQCVCNAAVYM